MNKSFKHICITLLFFSLFSCAQGNLPIHDPDPIVDPEEPEEPVNPEEPTDPEEPEEPEEPVNPEEPTDPEEPEEPEEPLETFYTVSFNYGDGIKLESDPDSIQVLEGSKIEYLPTPTKENYTFVAWFIDEETQLTTDLEIYSDLTAIAEYEENEIITPLIERKQRHRDYPLFDKIPEIRFSTTSGTDFATKPNKNSEKPEVSGKLSTTNCDEKYKLDEVKASMKVRGNYTTNYTKKPFRIKFDSKTNLFGLNDGKKFKKWVLFADVKDNSMLRNAAAFFMAGNMLNDNTFVTDFAPIHLFINEQYWGMYLLGEQKEVKSARIDIAEPEENYDGTDIGYVVELDNYYKEEGTDGDPTFTVDYKPTSINQHHQGENFNHIQNGYTMGSDITNSSQLTYIKKRIEMSYTIMYNAVYDGKFYEIQNEQLVESSETDIEKCLSKTIDIPSFVNMYLLNEICCDPDIGYSSFYLSLDMSKDGDKLLTLTNPWDWDSALGVRRGTVESAEGMYANVSSNMWLSMLCRTQFFNNLVKERWALLKEQNLFNRTLKMINDYTVKYKDDYAKNFNRWPGNMGNNPETNFELRSVCTKCKTQEEAKNILYTWLDARIKYLDKVFSIDGAGCFPPGSKKIEFDKQNAVKTRYEAENSVTNATIKTKTGENISKDQYVGDLDGNVGRTMTFTVSSNKACEALLSAGLSARTSGDKDFFDLFSITVNGQILEPTNSALIPKGTGRDYHCWTEIDVCLIKLTAGTNTIVLTAQNTSTNFDYIDIYIPK